MATVYFDVMHLYYIPQYILGISLLVENNIACHVILHREDEYLDRIKSDEVERLNINYQYTSSYDESFAILLADKPDWVIFGTAPNNNAGQPYLITRFLYQL